MSKTEALREAATDALRIFDWLARRSIYTDTDMATVHANLRAALAQQPAASGEPAAEVEMVQWPQVVAYPGGAGGLGAWVDVSTGDGPECITRYFAAAPQPAPARMPLTSGAIARCMLMVDDPLLWGRMGDQSGVALEQFARAIEAAHGIASAPAAQQEPKP